MNQKFASLGTALSREEAKKVMGGKKQFEFADGGGYMCCWTGTTNCSVCVPAGQPVCVAGATATKC